MTIRTVTTQDDLDAALADPSVGRIVIDSPRDVWLRLSSSGSATVEAYGSATVEASGSATVEAYDSATVGAYGSATVEAYGSATVRAYGSATVEASGSATVEAYGSATVRAYDSAMVEASGSATVRASGSATVRAYDSATVEAGRWVAVHLHSARASVTGGTVIDISNLDTKDTATWLDWNALDADGDATVTLFKAVDADLRPGHDAGRGITYTIGSEVVAPDWRDDHECGGGLHVSPSPAQAAGNSVGNVSRYLAVRVRVEDIRSIGWDKCKVPRLTVLREVDRLGGAVTS